jgi:hypothetical protein
VKFSLFSPWNRIQGVEAGAHQRGSLPGCNSPKPPPPKEKSKFKKKTDFVDIIWNFLRDFPFSRNQPLKSPDDWYIRILKNKLIKLKKKKQEELWLSDGTCSYIRMYIHAVADSVMLYLRHYFYKTIFKNKPKWFIASGLAPLPPTPNEKFWVNRCIALLILKLSAILRWSVSRLGRFILGKESPVPIQLLPPKQYTTSASPLQRPVS